MARTVNVHEAKIHLSRLLAEVGAGEEMLIAKAGKPVARLVAVHEKARKRVPGLDKAKVWLAEDFEAPLPPEMLDGFYK